MHACKCSNWVLQQLELIQGLGTLLRQQISHECCSSHDLRRQCPFAVYSTYLSGLNILSSPCSKFNCSCTPCTLYLPIAGCHKGHVLAWIVSYPINLCHSSNSGEKCNRQNSKCSKFCTKLRIYFHNQISAPLQNWDREKPNLNFACIWTQDRGSLRMKRSLAWWCHVPLSHHILKLMDWSNKDECQGFARVELHFYVNLKSTSLCMDSNSDMLCICYP